MKEVMQEYGSSILSVTVAVILFSIIFGKIELGGNRGFLAVLGEKTHVVQKEFERYKDASETSQAMERKRPVITYQNVVVQAGEKKFMEDCFTAIDVNGNPAKLELTRAENFKGEEIEIENGNIQFAGQGIYRIWVKATDAYCGVTERVFSIPVIKR